MNYPNNPPTYEESMRQNSQIYFERVFNQHNLKGPDEMYYGKYFMIADFIPWSEYSSDNEDINCLLFRVNEWLHENCQYEVKKCEFIPRMIDSRKKLDLSKCYIFNLTCGRTYFINQLRMHISIVKSKIEPDQISLKSYIPEMLKKSNTNIITFPCTFQFGFLDDIPLMEDVPALLSKINFDLNNGILSGHIINVSMFYSICEKENNLHKLQLKDDTIVAIGSSKTGFRLKSLRVFYKPGKMINGIIAMHSFSSVSQFMDLDKLMQEAICFVSAMENQNYISMETFPELEEENRFIRRKNEMDFDSTVVYGERLVRMESIKVFYFAQKILPLTSTQSDSIPLRIEWIVPKKVKGLYENYTSFMNYVNFVIKTYDSNIIDMETIIVPNALTWREIRYQTLLRYQNEHCTNYQIFAIRLILKNSGNVLIKPTLETCNILAENSHACSIL